MGFVLTGREHERIPPPENPKWMSEPVKIRRMGRGFYVKGHAVEMNETVWCDRYCAQGLVQMGRAELVDP